MIVLGYLMPTVIATFFIGFYAPLVGIVIGFFIHILVLLFRISKQLETLSNRFRDRDN